MNHKQFFINSTFITIILHKNDPVIFASGIIFV